MLASSSMEQEISMARPGMAALMTGARSSSSSRTPTEAGRRACCTRSTATAKTVPAGLIFDAAGNLYGTTYGGDHMITAAQARCCLQADAKADGSWTESVLHSFNSGDGAYSRRRPHLRCGRKSLRHDLRGGAHNFGTVFKLTPNADGSWTESVLYRFRGNPASTPFAGLIFDAAGNLYGTASGAPDPRMTARLSNCRPIRMEAGRTVCSTSSKASPL